MTMKKIGNAFNRSGTKKSQKTLRKRYMVNSLSKEDYSFFYENSVWDQYEDLVYAIQRGRYDQAI
jgi:hypothetical protein